VPDETPIDELIRCDVAGGVARVTINRPEAGNSLTAEMRDRLADTFQELSATLGVRAIVLTGAGERHFCTGAGLGAEGAELLDFPRRQRNTDAFARKQPGQRCAEAFACADNQRGFVFRNLHELFSNAGMAGLYSTT